VGLLGVRDHWHLVGFEEFAAIREVFGVMRFIGNVDPDVSRINEPLFAARLLIRRFPHTISSGAGIGVSRKRG
jgi:hypothetical protein